MLRFNRRKKRKIKKSKLVLVAVLLLFVSVGYAVFGANLTINGISSLASNAKWDIHFANINVLTQSDTVSADTPTITGEDKQKIEYEVYLNSKGDVYEFTADIVNEGTIDGEIEAITSTFKEDNGEPSENIPSYLDYSVTYLDDSPITNNHDLLKNESETIKVHIGLKDNLTDEEFNAIKGKTITSGLEVDFTQKDVKEIDDNQGGDTPVDPNKYTITFNTDGGSDINPIQITKGSPIGELPTSTKEGYYLEGWFDSATGGNEITSETIPDGNIELFARWKKSVENAELEEDKLNIAPGDSQPIVITNPNEIDENYTYESTNPDVATVDDEGNVTAVGEGETNIIITGEESGEEIVVHIVVTYTVTFNANGGSVNPTKKVVADGNSIGELPEPTKEDGYFDGWYTGIGSGIEIDEEFKPEEDIEVFARWSEREIPNNPCTYNGELVQGAEYTNGQYTYRYMQESAGDEWDNIDSDGWGITLTDKESTDPVTTAMCTSINNKPIVSMQGMFVGSKTSRIDTSSFDTTKVENMKGMFAGATNITALDLTSLDLRSLNTSINPTDFMFVENDNLLSITIPARFIPNEDIYIELPDTFYDEDNNEYYNLVIDNNSNEAITLQIKYELVIYNQSMVETETLSGMYPYNTEITLKALEENGLIFDKWSTGETTKTITFTLNRNVEIEPIYKINSVAMFNTGSILNEIIAEETGTLQTNQPISYSPNNQLEYNIRNVGNSNKTLKHFEKSNTLPEEITQLISEFNGNTSYEEKVNILGNKLLSSEDSGYDIYGWYDEENETYYYYSETNNIYLNYDSSNFFANLNTLEDVNGIKNTSSNLVNNISKMFYNCKNIEILDLSDFDLSSIKYKEETPIVYSPKPNTFQSTKNLIIELNENENSKNVLTNMNSLNIIVTPKLVNKNTKIELPGKYGYNNNSYEIIDKNTPVQTELVSLARTITLDPNGGELSEETIRAYKGEPITNIPEPYKNDENFDGWYTSVDGGIIIDENYIVQDDITIYAHWRDLDNYEVTFDKNNENATGTMENQIITERTTTNLNENKYSLDGYAFIGWNTKPDGSGYSYLDKSNIYITGNKTLYAQWIKTHKLTFDKNNPEAIGEEYSINIITGQTTKIPDESFEAYTLTSKAIENWNSKSDYTGDIYNKSDNITITEDTTLYALWDVPITKTIYWALQNNSKTLVISSNYVTGSKQGSFAGTRHFTSATEIPWLDNHQRLNITNLVIEGEVIPKYTAYWFYGLGQSVNSFDMNLNNLSTVRDEDMSYMFYIVGQNVYNDVTMTDISNWDVSRVKNMKSMFASYAHSTSNPVQLDLSNWNTSNVEDMSGMFAGFGEASESVSIIGINNWKTENVTDMSNMFRYSAVSSSKFNIDLSSWDTSKVTNMSSMFAATGLNAITWSIGDLSEWKTSNVTDMSGMFGYANWEGLDSPVYKINSAGKNAAIWDIGDLSEWNTSNVTTMSGMFLGAGYSANTWDIGDLRKWDTSNVESMSGMFDSTGYNATTWNIGDISNWNVSKVTGMGNMFYQAGYSATNWGIGDLNNWDTSNVTKFSLMFQYAGYNSETWESIGTIKIYCGSMEEMFRNCPNAKAVLNFYNTHDTGGSGYQYIFTNAATKPGSSIVLNYEHNDWGVIDNMVNTKSSNSNVTKGIKLEQE